MRKLLLSLLLVAAACSGSTEAGTTGDGGSASTTATSTTTTSTTTTTTVPVVTVAHDAGVAEIRGTPTRIAALSSVHVEMLFAISAGDQVIAGDLFSNYPDEAADLIKIDSFNLNVEEVITLEPDLVTLTFDPGGVVDALEAVGIPTLLLGTAQDLDSAYEQITILGLATGHPEGAEEVIEEMSGGIARIVRDHDQLLGGVTFYHEVDPFSFYTPNSNSFVGELYSMLGMVNIADAAPDEFDSGFPQLSPEFIVDSDPFVIVLASFGESVESLAARDGWDSMAAVQEGRVIVVDSDAAGRWGPRIVDVLQEIAEGVAQFVP